MKYLLILAVAALCLVTATLIVVTRKPRPNNIVAPSAMEPFITQLTLPKQKSQAAGMLSIVPQKLHESFFPPAGRYPALKNGWQFRIRKGMPQVGGQYPDEPFGPHFSGAVAGYVALYPDIDVHIPDAFFYFRDGRLYRAWSPQMAVDLVAGKIRCITMPYAEFHPEYDRIFEFSPHGDLVSFTSHSLDRPDNGTFSDNWNHLIPMRTDMFYNADTGHCVAVIDTNQSGGLISVEWFLGAKWFQRELDERGNLIRSDGQAVRFPATSP